jgi:archaetidylinositol phosphate synthase
MIDGHIKDKLDKIWDILAKGPIALGISANQITVLGLLLMLIVSITYPFWQNSVGYGILILAIFAFDSLDGAVARMTDTSSHFGGYLDAVVDRYQEMFVFAALAYTHDIWLEAFVVLSGSMLVSYAKARTAIEQPIDNVAWPDLMERLERVLVLCAGLIVAPLIPWNETWPVTYFGALLLGIGVLTHLTAIQRFLRAKRLLNGKNEK